MIERTAVDELRALAERLRLGVDEACARRLLRRFETVAASKRFLLAVEQAARRRAAREAA